MCQMLYKTVRTTIPGLLLGFCFLFVCCSALNNETSPLPGSEECDQLLIIENEKGVGYIDMTGKTIIPPGKFEITGVWSDDLLSVRIAGKSGFINMKGEVVIRPEYDTVCSFHEKRAVVKSKGKWGVIDKNGNWVVTPIYDRAIHVEDENRSRIISGNDLHYIYQYYKLSDVDTVYSWIDSRFENGMIKIKSKGRFGFIAPDGRQIIAPKFKQTGSWNGPGLAVKLESKWGVADKLGNLAVTPVYDSIINAGVGFFRIKSAGKWGYINHEGRIILPASLHSGWEFSEGYAVVEKETNGQKSYLDTNGVFLNNIFLQNAQQFSDGYAAVCKKNKWGYIDKKGKQVIETIFHEVRPFSAGAAWVKPAAKWGLIGSDGKWIIQPIYDEISFFKYGLAEVKLNNKWGLVDTLGKQVVEPQYNYIEKICPCGIFAVKPDQGKRAYINLHGKIIWQEQ